MAGRLAEATSALKDNPVIPVLLSSVTVLTALLAAFGGADAARRNNATLLIIAVVLVLVALLLGGFAALNDSKGMVAAALVALIAGLGCASLAALTHEAGRPTITASLKPKPNPALDVAVKRDGLGSRDQMELSVEGRKYDARRGDSDTEPPSLLYRASFGPNEKGEVDLSFSIPLPAKPRFQAVLLKTWVPPDSGSGEPELRCGPKQGKRIKHDAACVLAILPK